MDTGMINKLMTKFYYKHNHLCYQILFELNNGNIVPHKEYINYNEYKAAYNRLQDAINQDNNLSKVLEKEVA